jgi:hypothetical protein
VFTLRFVVQPPLLDSACTDFHFDLTPQHFEQHLHTLSAAKSQVKDRFVTRQRAVGDPHWITLFQTLKLNTTCRFDVCGPPLEFMNNMVWDRGSITPELDETYRARHPLQR